MLKPIYAIAVVLFLNGMQPQAPENLAITKAQWNEDLKYFARELPKRHKNLFHSMSRAQFDQAVAELEAAIPSLPSQQIIVRMLQITAKVGDGHTALHVPRTFRRYPLGVFWFGNDLRVIAATKEHERALGTRLVKIGGMPIDEVQARVSSCFASAENENQWFVMNTSQAFLVNADILHALAVVPDLERAPFTFEDDEGRQFTLEVASMVPDGSLLSRFQWAAASEPLTRQRKGERFWYTYLPESRTVYASFRGYDSLASDGRDLYKFIDSQATDRLVIDMRQNGGGDFFKGRKHLIEPIKKRPALNQKGKVFVVIGRQTFSAAMVNAIDFRKETNALLVGEPAGERPNSYSENDEMTLPNSRVVISYSTEYYKFLDEDAPAVLPDQRIDPSWTDYKAGRDPAMDWILSYSASAH
ncbi:MAG TPA: S41 family peptidase [Candidatus Polarisedimenticolia bacterium]|nr:S41 family peptidase [Candidatus Polarisedimenticolia bacterium]